MCGIAGFTQFNGTVGDRLTLKKMGDKIMHRGPDASGEFIDAEVGLCHRRLSIIDLSAAGNQPMQSGNGDYVIVFNGEIYNFLELRKELELEGHTFRTKTDTEVILALYARHGLNCLPKLYGMFAFAIWDKRKKELFLARDRLGKKPLYYYDNNKHFVFASEIKAILQVPTIPREIRCDAVYDYFMYQYVPDPKTIFKNIYKLKPGHWMLVNKKGVRCRQYWDVSFSGQGTKTEDEICHELNGIIATSTRQRMISDVPLGAFLSGGIDSSAIVGLMALNGSKPVTTCSISFDSKRFDEVAYARIIANRFNTDHHEFKVKQNVSEDLKNIASFFDEPFADSSFVPTYFVSKLARQRVTVALAGDGGDESFAGYEKYYIDSIENKIRHFFPEIMRRHLFPLFSGVLSKINTTITKKGTTLLNALSNNPSYGFFLTNSNFDAKIWDRLVNDAFRRDIGDYHPSSITSDYYHKADTDDHLSKILYTDIKTYLPGDILVKVDRMSMANSLEVRAPLLDHRVVEYAATIPAYLKLNQGEKKYILKKCFNTILPHDILYRKKMGFSVPLADWLRDEIKPIAEERLFHPNSGLSNFFKEEELRRIWFQHLNREKDNSNELWSLLAFELWWKNYIDKDLGIAQQ